jgi:hypothetical protein
MYPVRSDPLPWERLRTGVRGLEATEKAGDVGVVGGGDGRA